MWYKNCKCLILRFDVFSFLIIAISLVVSPSLADNIEKTEQIMQIQKVPGFEEDSVDYSLSVERKFSLHGPLDAIYEDRVVVGDITIHLQKNCEMNQVQEGDYVGIKLNNNKEAKFIVPIQKPD